MTRYEVTQELGGGGVVRPLGAALTGLFVVDAVGVPGRFPAVSAALSQTPRSCHKQTRATPAVASGRSLRGGDRAPVSRAAPGMFVRSGVAGGYTAPAGVTAWPRRCVRVVVADGGPRGTAPDLTLIRPGSGSPRCPVVFFPRDLSVAAAAVAGRCGQITADQSCRCPRPGWDPTPGRVGAKGSPVQRTPPQAGDLPKRRPAAVPGLPASHLTSAGAHP